MFNYPLFASKQTFARIDFLRQGGRLVDEKGTHNVKFIAEKLTKINLTSWQVNKRASELVNKLIVLFSFSKSTFSRHDNVRASPTLFIWFNENVHLFVCWHKYVHFWHKNIRNTNLNRLLEKYAFILPKETLNTRKQLNSRLYFKYQRKISLTLYFWTFVMADFG